MVACHGLPVVPDVFSELRSGRYKCRNFASGYMTFVEAARLVFKLNPDYYSKVAAEHVPTQTDLRPLARQIGNFLNTLTDMPTGVYDDGSPWIAQNQFKWLLLPKIVEKFVGRPMNLAAVEQVMLDVIPSDAVVAVY